MTHRLRVQPPKIRSYRRPRPAWDQTCIRAIDVDWDLGELDGTDFPPGRSDAEIQAIIAEITFELTG